MSKPLEEYKCKSGRILQIFHDGSPEDPRNWDNISKMVCFHRNYDLGDKHSLKKDDFENWDHLKQHLIDTEDVVLILPLSLYDHSGISMSIGSSRGWDSGIVGFIYITKDKLYEMGTSQGNGDGLLNDETEDEFKIRLAEYLENDVKTYDQFLSGDIYGFKLIEKTICDLGHEHEKEIDSCWGFYGDDIKTNGMLEHISEEDEPMNK